MLCNFNFIPAVTSVLLSGGKGFFRGGDEELVNFSGIVFFESQHRNLQTILKRAQNAFEVQRGNKKYVTFPWTPSPTTPQFMQVWRKQSPQSLDEAEQRTVL